MGIEEQIDRLIDLGEEIKSRLDRLVEMASDHSADASKMVVEGPPKKWRILEPGDVVRSGDWVNALCNNPDEDPPGGGWIPARASLIGQEASQVMGLYVARPVADEPAKEPEPEYREPVLPADAGKECEVSDDGKTWVGGKVYGWRVAPDSWWAWGRWHRFARIKKDA